VTRSQRKSHPCLYSLSCLFLVVSPPLPYYCYNCVLANKLSSEDYDYDGEDPLYLGELPDIQEATEHDDTEWFDDEPIEETKEEEKVEEKEEEQELPPEEVPHSSSRAKYLWGVAAAAGAVVGGVMIAVKVSRQEGEVVDEDDVVAAVALAGTKGAETSAA
jgi:hypothetical protein